MKKCPVVSVKTNLSTLQGDAENAAKRLKAARSALANAKQALAKAEEAHAVAQRTFEAGVEQVKNSTKVN